jgi:hypothetical protein
MSKLSLLLESNNDDGAQTLGIMYVLNELNEIQFMCRTLELPWKNNLKQKSCIPSGSYKVIKHQSPKFGKCFWVKDVTGRSEILIHPGNYNTQILGCVLVGDDLKDINKDWRLDVTNSKQTLEKLLKIMPSEFELKIVRL